MTMKYVKLIAKPNTWFKENTEVYHYDCDEYDKYRITLDEWNEWIKSGCVLARGIRIAQNKSELLEIGREYFDGESCLIDEFNVEIVDNRI